VVGGAPRLSRLGFIACAYLVAAAPAVAQPNVVGHCRGGVPNGAYELHAADGRLRVAGAFSLGHKTGTFIFWSAGGARVAVMPFDEDAKSGTVALWYATADGRTEAGRKLEAPYVDDRLHGVVRSWHANGTLRAVYRYDRGVLIGARAWSESGVALADAEARSLSEHDAAADEAFYASLLALVRDNPPACDAEGPNGETPRS
jgi:antitoxin component YwqK of YwqJK toxin-antitoxin module